MTNHEYNPWMFEDTDKKKKKLQRYLRKSVRFVNKQARQKDKNASVVLVGTWITPYPDHSGFDILTKVRFTKTGGVFVEDIESIEEFIFVRDIHSFIADVSERFTKFNYSGVRIFGVDKGR